MEDKIVEAVRADLLQRSQVGIKKYNTTLERTDLDLKDWLQHSYEECLDMANYLKRCIIELENTKNVNVEKEIFEYGIRTVTSHVQFAVTSQSQT